MATVERVRMMKAIAPYATSSTLHGLSLFGLDFFLYWLAVCGALFLPTLGLQVAASIFAGVKIGNLLTLGHDASHNTLVRGRRLNWLLAVLAFLPCVYNYRMWLFDHHVQHHAHTNGEHKDTYTPFTKAEFDQLPLWKQVLERMYRQPNPASFAIYYVIERWSQAKLMPHSRLPPGARRSAFRHLAFVATFQLSFIAVLTIAPRYSDNTALGAITLGFVLPFFVFMFLACFILWSMHTHPRVRWFRSGVSDPAEMLRGELASVHLVFPRPISWLLHDVTCHPVHHLHPRIPCYRLYDAQRHYNELFPEHVIVQVFSFRYVFDTMRRCKLYDFAGQHWQDFSGRRTTSIAEYRSPDIDFTVVLPEYSRHRLDSNSL